MRSAQISPSDLPYRAYMDQDPMRLARNGVASTESGQRVADIAARLRASCLVAPEDIALISLAAAVHPDALNGRALVWIDAGEAPLMAVEPGTSRLWHADPPLLLNSARPSAVIRCAAGKYSARVAGRFIPIEGEEALYKALLTAVHEYGADLVTNQAGKALRIALAELMLTQADALGRLWCNEHVDRIAWETADPFCASLPMSARECHRGLVARGQCSFVPKITNKHRVWESLAGLLPSFLSPLSHDAVLANVTASPALSGQDARYACALSYQDVHSAAPQHDALAPLVVATSAAISTRRHPLTSYQLRIALGAFGLTGLALAGRQLYARYYQGEDQAHFPAEMYCADPAVTLSQHDDGPPELTLADTAGDFSLFMPDEGEDDTPSFTSMTEEEGIAFRLTQHSPEAMLAMPPATTTTPSYPDDVKIERIDLTCVEERETLSLSKILRKIGKTLSYPLTELAKETQVIVYYEKLRRCPTEKEIKELEFIAIRVDSFISFFVSLLPDGAPIVLLQNIGGPLFQLLADAIENKELDIDNVNAVNDQILFLARTSWQFSPRERNGEVIVDKIKLPAHTKFNNNALTTSINNDAFSVRLNNGQYMGWNRRSLRPLTYSPSEERWLFSEPEAYLFEVQYHEDMVNDYKVTPHYIQSMIKQNTAKKTVFLDKKYNIMYVLKENDSYGKFIYLEQGKDKFNVECDFYKINGMNYGYAKKEGADNRVVRLNHTNFYFEARSTTINEALAKVLDKHNAPHVISDAFHVTHIMRDGFCYDNGKRKYLKYNNGYYPVEQGEHGDYSISFNEQGEYKKHYIKKRDSGFFDVDDGFSPQRIARTFTQADEGFFIAKETAAEIGKHCLPLTAETKIKVDNGIFKNKKGQLFFQLNGQGYHIGSRVNNVITIKSKYANVDDIPLYMTHDYFFEMTKGKKNNKNNFIEITSPTCRAKRSPPTASCNAIFMSPRADKLLRAKARRAGVGLDIDEEHLVLSPLFPSLFINTKNDKLYFRYEGSYYRATFNADKQNNMLRERTLHVYYKGFLGSRNIIASLVFDVADGKTILQTQEEVLADKVGMTSKEAQDFVQIHEFVKITDFENLADVVMEVSKKDKLKFVERVEYIDLSLNLYKETKEAFQYSDYDFKIIAIPDISDQEPMYIRGGGLMIKGAIKHAAEMLDVAVRELDRFTLNTQKYLGYILGEEHRGVIRDFAVRLSYDLKEVREKMCDENVKLVAKKLAPIASDVAERDTVRDTDTLSNAPESETYFHQAGLTEEQRKSGVFAFVPLDINKNIYVCLERFYFIDPIHPDESLRQKHTLDISETLIHEASHSMGVNHDAIYIKVEDGKLSPILDALDEVKASIVTDELYDKDAFIRMQQKYMKLHPEYSSFIGRGWGQNNNYVLHYMFVHDPGFRSNVLLSTPDFFAIMTRDLYQNAGVELPAP